MAMKVTKSTIHRLTITMSCGCQMYAEFEDAQCKKPTGNGQLKVDGEVEADKIFKACSKHEKDAGLTMLQFIVGERLDEAVEDAKKGPVTPTRLYTLPGIEEGDTGGVVAAAGNVQSVMKVSKPVAVRPRAADPTAIKTIQRSSDQLTKVGAAPMHVQGGGAAEMQMEEVAEDTRYTPHIEEALDFLDPKESGLLEDVDIGEDEG